MSKNKRNRILHRLNDKDLIDTIIDTRFYIRRIAIPLGNMIPLTKEEKREKFNIPINTDKTTVNSIRNGPNTKVVASPFFNRSFRHKSEQFAFIRCFHNTEDRYRYIDRIFEQILYAVLYWPEFEHIYQYDVDIGYEDEIVSIQLVNGVVKSDRCALSASHKQRTSVLNGIEEDRYRYLNLRTIHGHAFSHGVVHDRIYAYNVFNDSINSDKPYWELSKGRGKQKKGRKRKLLPFPKGNAENPTIYAHIIYRFRYLLKYVHINTNSFLSERRGKYDEFINASAALLFNKLVRLTIDNPALMFLVTVYAAETKSLELPHVLSPRSKWRWRWDRQASGYKIYIDGKEDDPLYDTMLIDIDDPHLIPKLQSMMLGTDQLEREKTNANKNKP